jgi:DNA-binding transcriptional regulator YiaG
MTPKKLKQVRLFLQLSQTEFAKLIGNKSKESKRTIRRYETGESRIPGAVSMLVEQIMKDKGIT